MSGKSNRVRSSASSSVESATSSLNEKILGECFRLYSDPNRGLVSIARNLDLKLLAPRKKISIMLIGNHSAGKSSFINWYIEEHIQRTGVAIETQGFSFVTSGRRRESLSGNATLHLYPHFSPLAEFGGVMEYLQTEISTSKQKKFPLVTFIDTPGLVDGDMNYPFDVNKIMLWFGERVDLIFVFFDPIGQALCKRTLSIVEKVSENHAEKMRFYLSKADEAGHESDRQRVMMQIVQEICKRPGLNRTGFEMPTIYIPNPNKEVRCINQIEDVCRDIEKTITHTVQNTLNHLERDCDEIGQQVDHAVKVDNEAKSYNFWRNFKRFLYLCVASLPGFLILSFFLPKGLVDEYFFLLEPCTSFWALVPTKMQYPILGAASFLVLIILGIASSLSTPRNTMTRKMKKTLLEQQEFVTTVVKDKKKSLYQEYLKNLLSEHDL